MNTNDSIVVVGAGISGLCTAWYLRESGYKNILLLESSETAGGQIKETITSIGSTDIGCILRGSPSPCLDEIGSKCGYTPTQVNIRCPYIVQQDGSSFLWSVPDEMATELKDEIKDVRTELISAMNKNTDDLVEIITTGFSTHEAQYQNHEVRIIHLEKTPLPSN